MAAVLPSVQASPHRFRTSMDHFYKCFGCGRRHDAKTRAILCCAVVQEIFGCESCGRAFPTLAAFDRHSPYCPAAAIDDGDATVSFASGYNNFSPV